MSAESDLGREIMSTRLVPAACPAVYAAFAAPERLAAWWGPRGFTSVIHCFDLRPGGRWRITLRDPAGQSFENESEFLTVRPGEEVVFRHLDPVHDFTMTLTFAPEENGTRLTWRMVFADAAECTRCRAVITSANEENFDRLEHHLATFNP